MIDVFFCAYDHEDELRHHMATLCLARWERERWANVIKLTEEETGKPFQMMRRVYAEDNSDSEYYIVTDDDCLLYSFPVLFEMVKIMELNPTIGQLALKHAGFPWQPTNDDLDRYLVTDDVVECQKDHGVGGVRMLRKGVVKEWPEPERDDKYDFQHSMAVRDSGYVNAFARKVGYMHIGSTYSSWHDYKNEGMRWWEKETCIQLPDYLEEYFKND